MPNDTWTVRYPARTLRHEAAIEAMKVLIPILSEDRMASEIASDAVAYADALCRELERAEKEGSNG